MMHNTTTSSLPSHLWVSEIKQDDQVRGQYLVRTKRTASTKKGAPFLIITLSDRTGEIEAKVWDRVEEFAPLFKEGDVLEVDGIAGPYRNQLQITLSTLRAVTEVSDPSIFLEVTRKDINKMMGSLRELLKTIRHSRIKALVESFLADRQFIGLFKHAPAAKSFHHSYVGGLLEHTLSVCQMTRSIADHYPQLDSDLLLAGAFLHDIGKVRELRWDRLIDYTDEGRLIGHLTLGVTMMDERLARLGRFPEEIGQRLKHLILSHHGEYEFGSPKRPKFLEAFALHLIDDLDAKINGLSRFMEKDKQEGHWTDFNRLFERYFLKVKMQSADKTEGDFDDRQKGLFPPSD
ncbi:MAG TPA: HD domain-containing protein [Thermodesulfobacteriota bacterium]|nr:HD domain-containing protein [Thermodesulfobacteriota bacterium]